MKTDNKTDMKQLQHSVNVHPKEMDGNEKMSHLSKDPSALPHTRKALVKMPVTFTSFLWASSLIKAVIHRLASG